MTTMTAARAVLHKLIKDSPHKFKDVAEQVGERPDTLSSRLSKRGFVGYNLDVGLVLAILDTIGVSFTEYARLVEEADR